MKIYEKGSESGGIWYWNCYPGARVDSDTPIYQLFDKELWEDFTFKERYPGWQELRRYFQHVEKKWDVKSHTEYHKQVDSAFFDEEKQQWLVECSDGTEIYCRWFLPCIGFASKRYTPPFPGLGNFKGEVYHTAVWPQQGVNLKNKRIAHFGTGASGIQVVQEVGDKAKHLTLYMRTPNLCLPMNQRVLDPKEEEEKKKQGVYEARFNDTRRTFAGFTYDFIPKKTFDDTPEEREAFYHKLMVEEGGFRYWLNTYVGLNTHGKDIQLTSRSSYDDMLFDQKANDEAYNFWRKTVLKRIKNPEKQRLLAPEKPPHPWGTKRPSLEQRFYEVVDQDHVDIIDVNEHPIQEVTETGLKTSKGFVEVDVIVLATGFDSVTGSLGQLNIQSVNGGTIADHWKDGLKTSMGIALPGFPNMFFLYGPQAPTAFSNGPSCTQFQAEFVEELIKRALAEDITRVEATQEAEDDWSKRMHDEWDATLFPLAKGWYSGGNIPGKRIEPLNWAGTSDSLLITTKHDNLLDAGGMVKYVTSLHDSLDGNYQGWKISKEAKASA